MITLANTAETRELRKLIANELGLTLKSVPVCSFAIVAGYQPPEKTGQGGHWITPNGSICHHPGAYRKRFGRPVYKASCHKITTGIDWLLAKTDMNRELLLSLQAQLHSELIGAAP